MQTIPPVDPALAAAAAQRAQEEAARQSTLTSDAVVATLDVIGQVGDLAFTVLSFTGDCACAVGQGVGAVCSVLTDLG